MLWGLRDRYNTVRPQITFGAAFGRSNAVYDTNPTNIHYGGVPVEPPPPPAPPPNIETEFVQRAHAAFQVSEP